MGLAKGQAMNFAMKIFCKFVFSGTFDVLSCSHFLTISLTIEFVWLYALISSIVPENVRTVNLRSFYAVFSLADKRKVQTASASTAPINWAIMKPIICSGLMPANVFENPLAMVTAGFAKDVEAVNQ